MQNKAKLLKILSDRGLSRSALALKCGINPSALYNALNGKTIMWPKYKKSISDFLGMPEEELFEDLAGNLNGWISINDRLPELTRDFANDLTEDDRKIEGWDTWKESEDVLVLRKDGCMDVAYLSLLGTIDSVPAWLDRTDDIEVTHWMPLPNPLEEE